jgi:fluoride exporter
MPRTAHPFARVEAHALSAAVFVGGCLGALARAGIDRAVPVSAGAWPWATFAANIAGTSALALFATRFQERLPPSTYRRPLLGTGLCGALTTFSTLQIELIRLARHGHAGLAAGYAAASVAAGLATMFVVTKLARRARLR